MRSRGLWDVVGLASDSLIYDDELLNMLKYFAQKVGFFEILAGVLYAHRNEEVVNLGGAVQKHKRPKSKEQICSMNDPKTLIPSFVVDEHQRLATPSTLKILSENGQEDDTVGQKRKYEEIFKLEEMDETTKWFLSGSSLCPTQSIDCCKAVFK